MPLLNPRIPTGEDLAVEQALLTQKGLAVTKPDTIHGEVCSALDRAGLTVDNAAQNLGTLALYSDNESVKLQALKLAFHMRGALEPRQQQGNGTSINFIVHSDKVNLQNIFNPNRENNE